MGTTATRTCPECGSPNSGLSLFCSECGASLSGAPSNLASEPDDQTTATFRPAADEGIASDPYATQTFRVAPAASPQTTTSGATAASLPWADTGTASSTALRETGSRRGLVLGWIAAILILLVIGFFAWSSLLDPDTRDSITGIFG